MYTKTESDDKYAPYSGATKDIHLGNQSLEFLDLDSDNNEITNVITTVGMYLIDKFGDTYYKNHKITYSTNSSSAILYFPGTEEAVGKTSVIAIKSDLPTAISTSDLNTILV